MFKRLLFSSFLLCFALSVNAQIATPLFDPGFYVYGSAATAWYPNSSVNLNAVDAKGDVESNVTIDGSATKVGDVKAGLSGKGPDNSSSLPTFTGVYKGESLAAKLNIGIGGGLLTDIDTEIDLKATSPTTAAAIGTGTGALSTKTYKDETDTRAHLAYIVGKNLSIGLGVRQGVLKTTTQDNYVVTAALSPAVCASLGAGLVTSCTVNQEETTEFSTNSTSINVSWKLAEIVYLAAGVESVNQSGTKETAAGTSDYVANSWMTTMYGVGLMTGKPGETQFRAEYSLISEPESVKDADGTKLESVKEKTTFTFMSLEAKFSNFLLSYQSETESYDYSATDLEYNSITNWMGVGWQPQKGLSVSLFTLNKEVVRKSGTSEMKMKPSGTRLTVGYAF